MDYYTRCLKGAPPFGVFAASGIPISHLSRITKKEAVGGAGHKEIPSYQPFPHAGWVSSWLRNVNVMRIMITGCWVLIPLNQLDIFGIL